jgi:hypothetical protein
MKKTTAHTPVHEIIAERACLLWAAAGRPSGEDITFWLLAERELTREASSSDEPDVIDLEIDTAFGNLGGVPNLDDASKRSMPAGATFDFTSNSRKGTSL